MASYHHFLHDSSQNQRFESPAKVFAKLKAKVQREAISAKEGVSTDEDTPRNAREKCGPRFRSPRKRSDSIWMTDDREEIQRFGSYRDEVQAVTLSPIASPQKTFGHSFVDTGNKHVDNMPPMAEYDPSFISRHGRTLTHRAVLESTAVSAPVFLVNREQTFSQPTLVRDVDGFTTNRTPMKIQPMLNDRVRSVFEVESAAQNQMSPAKMYSPMKNRLRKRKADQDFSNTINAEVAAQTHHRNSCSVLSHADSNTDTEDLGVRGFPTDLFSSPTRSIFGKRCSVMEKIPQMSPAKMFAYMKQRENKREQREVHKVTSSTREPFSGNHNRSELCDSNFRNLPELVIPLKRCRVETADRQSHPSAEDVIPDVQTQPVLLEDPLVLNSPCISIPKKRQTVVKPKKLPLCEKLPNESVIYLKQWFLRKNQMGLFVDGIHREENIPWNSNIIIKRVSESAVETVSGRVYFLVGKMKMDVSSGFPTWFLKKFVNGFPPNWKALYEKFLSESRDRETKKNSEGRNRIVKKNSEAPSLNVSLQRNRQNPWKTPASCPPVSSIKVSRSGRTIKPPLEYWKGGRVILDAHMNVTIHECYDTSICVPEVTTTVSARKSEKPTRLFLPCSEGRKQCESASEEEASVPLRKVKVSRRKRNQAKTDPEDSPPETFRSPTEVSRITRSSQRCPAAERMLHLDTALQKQRESEKASTGRSQKQKHDTNRPALRERKQTVTTSPESLTGSDKTFQQQLSDEEFIIKRKIQQKGQNRRRRGRVLSKPQQNHTPPSSESSEVSDESVKKRQKKTRVTKTSDATQTQKKCNKRSPPTKPLPKSTQSSKTDKANKGHMVVPHEQDEDGWTGAELMKLQEAVSYYPKHVTGYWAKVAKMVGTRSAAECHRQHTFQGTSQSPAEKAIKPRKEKTEAPKDPVADHPVISARAGTFKRKQQVRQFLEAMPKEDVDDIFSSAYMQNRRFEMPSICPSDDHDFAMSDVEPVTPMSKLIPDVKTPQCLHITPGMMGSPNRNNDDKYVYQLQKRMKKNQFNVCKQARPLKSFTPTPSVKQTMRRCGTTENDTFVVWEMFPGNEEPLSESGEEEDFYFSDND